MVAELTQASGTDFYLMIEAVFTYEGTDTIQSLIVGREITGVQAFSPR